MGFLDAKRTEPDNHPAKGRSNRMAAIAIGLIGFCLVAGPAISDSIASEQGAATTSGSSATAALDYLAKELQGREGLIWTGHTNPDTDSLGASLLAAFLHGGQSGLPGPLNPESRFALDQCNADEPEVIADFSGRPVALVDFNQSTQLPPGIDPDLIAAIIDHHAIGGSPLNLPDVISIEIRPWGSTATILADQAKMLGIEFPAALACVGLAAILSDTINLTSPTTTDYDRTYAHELAQQAGIDDFNEFAGRMLLAKSDLSGFSAEDIVMLDYKDFDFGGQKVGIGVAETLTGQELIDRRYELKSAIEALKRKRGLDHLIFAIVDTRDQKSYLLWGDDADRDIVLAAFGGAVADDMLVADGVVSRKRQIGPAIQRAVENAKSD
ncbi:MAG: manganese-dependent inorganic pyrophosphatase [Alphaproteobacteria bacterium]|nr:manganese-dependent inorganic pyrophosphatase [Alphaproteobacteria bacterium]